MRRDSQRPPEHDAGITAMGHVLVTRLCTWGVILAVLALLFGL